MKIFYLGIKFEADTIQAELAQDAIDAVDELEFYARNHQKLKEKLKAKFFDSWATSQSQSEAIEKAKLSDSLLDLSFSVCLLKSGIAQKKIRSIESPCRASCWSV